MLLEGASYCPILKWLAHKSFKLKKGCYSIGYKYENCYLKCRILQNKWCLLKGMRNPLSFHDISPLGAVDSRQLILP